MRGCVAYAPSILCAVRRDVEADGPDPPPGVGWWSPRPDAHLPFPLRRLSSTFVGTLLGLGAAAGVVTVWLQGAAGLVPLPEVEDGVQVVVLGNSIALADVDPEAVARALGPPSPAVVQLAERGSQPAHWLALARHRLFAQGHRPSQVVVVTPLELLLQERLTAPRDTARLLALLVRPDPALWEVAVGPDGGLAYARRQREAARFLSMSGLTAWLPHLLGLEQPLQAARARMSAIPRDPTARPAWIVDPGAPSPGRADRDTRQREPSAVRASDWRVLPALLDEVRAHDAALWVVVPPLDPSERRGRCARNDQQQSVADALQASGVVLLDLTDADVPADWFVTRHHLDERGRAWMSATLAAALSTHPYNGGRPGCG